MLLGQEAKTPRLGRINLIIVGQNEMHIVGDQLQNPLTRERNARDRARLKELFPDLSRCSENHFLALRGYLQNCPESFFNEAAYAYLLEWLKRRDATGRPALHAYLAGNNPEINRALLFLREINSESWHDELLRNWDDYDLIRFIDKHVHRTYLRLVEAILFPLVRGVAYFSRLDRGKGTDGLDVWSTVQELSGSAASCLVQSYRHIVRNAIAHGGITYLQHEVRYRDKKGNQETRGISDIIRLCDDLLDTCNGLAAALKVFLIVSRHLGYLLPQQILLEELQEETHTPWWRIESCVQSEIGAQKQMLIYARPDSRDFLKIQWSAMQSGIMAEFFAPGYDRYFLSLRSPKAGPGWTAFDGKRLEQLRLADASDIAQYHGVVENNLVFCVPRLALPRALARIDTFAHSFRLNWPLAMERLRLQLKIPHVVCRNASLHPNSWSLVLTGEVVINEFNDRLGLGIVHKWRRRIIRTALKAARRTAGWLTAARYLPLGYARLALFRKNYRRRRLSGFGLGEDLVCTVQFQRIRRIRSPDIMGSTIEASGKWRIAWNRAWLEAAGHRTHVLDGYSADA